MTTLRNYNDDTPQYHFYKKMHENQSLDYVLKMKDKYSILNNKKMSIHKSLSLLDVYCLSMLFSSTVTSTVEQAILNIFVYVSRLHKYFS